MPVEYRDALFLLNPGGLEIEQSLFAVVEDVLQQLLAIHRLQHEPVTPADAVLDAKAWIEDGTAGIGEARHGVLTFDRNCSRI